MKNVLFTVKIWQDRFGESFACMDEKIIDGKRFAVMMDHSGQHEMIYENDFYTLRYMGEVACNDAKLVCRLLHELNTCNRLLKEREQKTYVWGFQLLNPVYYSPFKLELWKR